MDIRNRIKAFLESSRQQGQSSLVSPLPENDTLDTMGKLAYVRMNQQREEAAANAVPVADQNWSPNYHPSVGNHPQNIASPYGEEQIPPMERARQMAMGAGQSVSTGWNDFVKAASKVAKETGMPLQVMLGQAALETGRGDHVPGNNYFGIKGSGTAGSQNLGTKEADGSGQLYDTRGNFGAYNNAEESARAYVELIKNRYKNAWNARKNPTKMIQEIYKGGYATDPKYIDKVTGTPEFRGEYGN